MDVSAPAGRLPLGVRSVESLARLALARERIRRARLSFAFVSPKRIARLNREHLGHAGATDVITFALGRVTPDAPLVGDVYIAPDVVRAQARDQGVSVREELARVVLHGTLHALGYDHPARRGREASPMWRRQERLLRLARAEGLL